MSTFTLRAQGRRTVASFDQTCGQSGYSRRAVLSSFDLRRPESLRAPSCRLRSLRVPVMPVSYPPPAKCERGRPLFTPRTLLDTAAVAVFRAGQGLVTATRHVRSPTRGLVAVAHDENTAKQVQSQLPVARRVKVKLAKACFLESCFGDGHFACSLSLVVESGYAPICMGRAAGGSVNRPSLQVVALLPPRGICRHLTY
jgi:hypothetical protein